MLDSDIRRSVETELRRLHGPEPATRYRHELGLCMGQTRVDVAAINGALTGCEIKSARDKLSRLPRQVDLYGQVLDVAVIVAEGKYAHRVGDYVPSWWGIWQAEDVDGQAVLHERRPAGVNPSPNAFAIAQLLWRDEALDELRSRGAARGLSGKARHYVWVRLVEELSFDELRLLVRSTLKERPGW